MKEEFAPTREQLNVYNFAGNKMVVSASAGSGKTTTMINYIFNLINNGEPVRRMLVLTFTKAAANEMKDRLLKKFVSKSDSNNIASQIDELFLSDISTIHSFLEKILKRNLGQLSKLDTFKILDETSAMLLKEEALEQAQQEFKNNKNKDYFNLFLTFRNKDLINSIILTLDDFLSAQSNREKIIDKMRNGIDCFNRAEQYIFSKLNDMFASLKEKINNFPNDNSKAYDYLQSIKQAVCIKKENLAELANYLVQIKLDKQPSLKDYDKKEDVVKIKEKANEIINLAKKLNPSEKCVWDKEKNNYFINLIFDFYEIYDKKYQELKLNNNSLDFNDLEKQSERLLEDEQIKNSIQECYDYVFIDEYQDTNPVQEKIVKMLSEKCTFIAIGDAKQGIYGFRNATSKIILKDSEDFAKLPDGKTQYLSENFRSDKKILAFVNHVFDKIMTDKTSGIEYSPSSVLKGNIDSEKTSQPAVQILISKPLSKEKETPCLDYDIYNDSLVCKQGCEEAKIVAVKIEQLLMDFFVDPKTGAKRRVEPKDIAILSRSRSSVTSSIMLELNRRGLPFVSSLKTNITEKAHSKFVVDLLSLCLDEDNDIALASYLFSPLVLADMDELILEGENLSFSQKVHLSQNEKIKNALSRFRIFKNDCYFLGARQALEKLFNEKEYFVYLKSLSVDDYYETMSLLDIISSYENDKDIPSLITYLKKPIEISVASGQNAITISSIHASKGLEYPIVFLVGSGKNMIRPDTNTFKIGEEFGLGIMQYDRESSKAYPSLILHANRMQYYQKERASELMVLYVALTRAKSHLIITGDIKEEKIHDFDENEFNSFGSYLSLIMSTNPQESGAVVEQESVEELENVEFENVNANVSEQELAKDINDYLNYEYPYLNQTKIVKKSSVTALSHSGQEFKGDMSDFALQGTAYHEAMRIIDFEKVNNVEDIKNQLKNKKIDENYSNLIDFSIILKNIQLIKPFIKNKKIIKEKPFTMRLDLAEGASMVQGVIDLFLRGDKNILIDYKYTNENDENILKARYFKQLELYKKAIENAEKIKVDEVYLISLKNCKIIKY